MNAKTNKQVDELLKDVNELFQHESKEDRLEFKAAAIQLDILADVSKVLEDKKISRSDLAKALGKSKSFISQLFSGDKMLNLKMIAQIQDVLNKKFQSSFKDYSDYTKKAKFFKDDYIDDEYKTKAVIYDINDGTPLKAA